MEQKTMTPRQKKTAAIKQRICDAAQQLIARYGYDGVTVTDICREAGVSNGSFYHHYASKDSVLASMYNVVDAYYKALEKKLPASPASARLLDLLRYMGRFAHEQGRDFIANSFLVHMRQGFDGIYSLDRVSYRLILETIRQGQKGEFRTDKPAEALAEFSLVTILGVIHWWIVSGPRFDIASKMEEYAASVVELLKRRDPLPV
jgi:TetR/AcrR family fatty acid metabolism transcriptional regulator